VACFVVAGFELAGFAAGSDPLKEAKTTDCYSYLRLQGNR
jgi:hypothetical protein